MITTPISSTVSHSKGKYPDTSWFRPMQWVSGSPPVVLINTVGLHFQNPWTQHELSI